MDEANPISSPMVGGFKLTKSGYEPLPDPTLDRFIVGALQYATITRPEISFTVNKVCQYMSDPTEQHWAAVKRILRYLAGTINFGWKILPPSTGPPFTVNAYCDDDNRRSTSGAAIIFGSNLVSWWSKKQSVVARSSTEAEYCSLALATAEVTWIRSLLSEHCTLLITLQSSFVKIRALLLLLTILLCTLEPSIWNWISSLLEKKFRRSNFKWFTFLPLIRRLIF